MKKEFFYTSIIFSLMFVSCASLKKVETDEGYDLRLVILDETNRPVPDYNLYLIENGKVISKSSTNKEGFCSFPAFGKGKAYIIGEKAEFTKLKNLEVNLERKTDIFLCTVTSAAKALDKVDSLIEKKQFDEALVLLNEIEYRENTYLETCCLLYKAAILFSEKNYDDSLSALNQINFQNFPEYLSFYGLVEKYTSIQEDL